MRKLALAAAIAAILPVYAAQAQSTAEIALSANDPKFETPRCRAARARLDRFAKETGSDRFAFRAILFAALGNWVPPGTYEPNDEHQAIARDLRKHCISSKPKRR